MIHLSKKLCFRQKWLMVWNIPCMIHFTIKNPSFMKVPSQIHQITSLRFSLRYFLPHLSQYKICLPLKKIKKNTFKPCFLRTTWIGKKKQKRKSSSRVTVLAQAAGRPMGLFSTRVPNSGVQPGLILQLIPGPNLAGTNSKKPKICSLLVTATMMRMLLICMISSNRRKVWFL